MKKILGLIMLAIIMIGLGACSKDSTSLVGSWSRTFDGELFVITFYDNGTATSTTGTDSNPPGKYTVSGSNLNVTSEDCGSYTGNYIFIIENDVLTIGLVSDDCYDRRQVLPGTYIKK